MLKSSMCKVFTFINCGRRVELPGRVNPYSIGDFVTTMEAQISLEKGIHDKRTKTHLSTLRLFPNVLRLIDKYQGTFYRWRRDICTGVIVIEVTFEDMNNLYGYGYDVSRFPNITSKYVYTAIFDGKNHIPVATRDLKYPRRMATIMTDAAKDEVTFSQENFYREIAFFFDFLDDMPIYKVKSFKNEYGSLTIDIMFMYYHDFSIFKDEMRYWS